MTSSDDAGSEQYDSSSSNESDKEFSDQSHNESSGDSDMDVGEMRQTVTYSFADAIRGICQRYETDEDQSDILDLSSMKVVEDKGRLRSEPTMGLGSYYEHTADPQYKEVRSYQKTVRKLKRRKKNDSQSSGSDSDGGRDSAGTTGSHGKEATNKSKQTSRNKQPKAQAGCRNADSNKTRKGDDAKRRRVSSPKERGYTPRVCTGSLLTCTKAFCFACECGMPQS